MSHWIEGQSAHPAAVLSPHLEAIQACANSWNDSANINVGISKIRVSGESLKRMVSSLDDEFYIPLSNNVYQCGYIFVL